MTNEREIKEVVERLRSNVCPPNTGCNVNKVCACSEMDDAAAMIQRLAAERDKALAKADDNILYREHIAACQVIPQEHLLDPPDGGDVKLHEGITRYAAAEYERGKAEAQVLLDEALAALEPIAGNHPAPEYHTDDSSRLIATTEGDLRTARAVRDKIKGAQP